MTSSTILKRYPVGRCYEVVTSPGSYAPIYMTLTGDQYLRPSHGPFLLVSIRLSTNEVLLRYANKKQTFYHCVFITAKGEKIEGPLDELQLKKLRIPTAANAARDRVRNAAYAR